jgi:hypothetical protein
MSTKQTPKEAGLKYETFCPEFGFHVFSDETGKREAWAANKNHASYGLKWRNTHLEFITSLPAK